MSELAADEQCHRLAARVRSQITQLRYLYTFVEAYEAEGWRHASREKLKPSHELQAARRKIRHIKQLVVRLLQEIASLRDRDASIPYLVELEAQSDDGNDEGGCPSDSDTSNRHAQHIYCSRCSLSHTTEENDILLCDNEGCCRAFHQQCQVPVVKTEDIPEGEDPWYCTSCESLYTALKAINNACDTEYETVGEVFPELNDEDDDGVSSVESVEGDALPIFNEDGESDDDEFTADSDESGNSSSDEDTGSDALQDSMVLKSDVSDGEIEHLDVHDILDPHTRSTRSKITTKHNATNECNQYVGRRTQKLNQAGNPVSGVVVECCSRVPERWRVVFYDGTMETVDEGTLTLAIAQAPSDAEEDENPHEQEVDESLIVHGKRKRRRVDYRALNDMMFDGRADSDVDDDDVDADSDGSDADDDHEPDSTAAVRTKPEMSPHGCTPKRSRRQRRNIDYRILHEGIAI